ncbi:hypothetical protein QE152_g21890 [Popillia japonica]|uniref:Uncharacterized protein n=1 Tax=Popillia japonica TaxID=7064 RepID=A0AAW1KNU1_POPJA
MAKRKYLTAEELTRALEDSDDENYIFSDNDDEDGDFAVDNASDSEDDDQVCSDNEDEEGSNNSNYNTPIIEYVSKDQSINRSKMEQNGTQNREKQEKLHIIT